MTTKTQISVFPYRQGSRSAIALAKTSGGKLIRRENSKFRPRPGRFLVNWGASDIPPDYSVCNVLNTARAIAQVSNKRSFFQLMSSRETDQEPPRIPEWTLNKREAQEWLGSGSQMIFARTVLQGHSGEGIVKIRTPEELEAIQDNTLLVRYVSKRREFRLHLGRSHEGQVQVISLQEKLASTSVAETDRDYQVRNYQNGFIFARNNLEIPPDVMHQATLAFELTQLDFGAIDVIWKQRTGEAFVLEINTAPGLEGSTVMDYSSWLLERYKVAGGE